MNGDAAEAPAASSPAGASAVLLVFAKAPVPGRVKTRLAADVGAAAATAVYRVMGRTVVDAVRVGPWRTVVCYHPPDALAEVRAWLGGELDYWPQQGHDLGARMDQALRRALASSSRACLIGTDTPRVDAARVHEALVALEAADVVFGPAEDGGYYLLALRQPAPELFRRIPWGTSRVLARSTARAAAAELSVALLPPLADVDTVSDLASFPDLARTIDGTGGLAP